MSKIIDSLKKAENKKNGRKYPQNADNSHLEASEETIISAAQRTQDTESEIDFSVPHPRIIDKARPKPAWMLSLAIVASLFLLLGISLSLILKLNNYSKTSTNIATKLNRLEELLDKNNKQSTSFSKQLAKQEQILDKLSRQEQDNQAQIAQLDKKVSAQAVSIDNLTKAKKALFNRVSALESSANTETTNESIKK